MKRKKFWIIFPFFLLFFAFSLIPTVFPAYAKTEKSSVEDELKKEVDEGVKHFVSDELEEFFQGLDDAGKTSFGKNVKEIVEKIIRGEQTLSVETVFELVFGAVRTQFFALTLSMTTVIMLSILLGVAKNLNSGFSTEGTSKVIYFAVYAAIIATMCVQLNQAILATKTMAANVKSLTEILFPVMITVMTAIGSTAGSAAYQPLVVIIGKVVTGLIEGLILPIFYATVVFSIVGNLGEQIRLNKISDALNTFAKWALGAVFGVTIAVVSLQGIVGASIDGVGIRTAKFALQSYVPVLGGYLTEGFDIVMASCILLKNAFGLTGVILLLMIIMSPAVTLVVTMLSFKLIAGIVEPFSDPKIANLFSSAAKSLNILISVVLGMGFLVLLSLFLMIQNCNMGVA